MMVDDIEYVVVDWLFAVRVYFFFSSRRRHTRFDCDWSSDVCSSDLSAVPYMKTAVPGTRSGGSAARSASSILRGTVFSSMRLPRISRPRFQVVISRRSEEHTSEPQSQSNLVCRLLLEIKKRITTALT